MHLRRWRAGSPDGTENARQIELTCHQAPARGHAGLMAQSATISHAALHYREIVAAADDRQVDGAIE